MTVGAIRIIGGKWRGRKISVPDLPNLRPTPNRVRETLFNWLAPYIENAVCLDPFAGSGALGFEALSRGAAKVVMVDQSIEVIKQLKKQAELLKTSEAEVYQARAPQLLKPGKFNIVFLDPPFQHDLLIPTCFYLEQNDFLANPAHIYLESNQMVEEKNLPANWTLLKSKKAGDVFYYLALSDTLSKI